MEEEVFGVSQIFMRYGHSFIMRVTPTNAGAFLDNLDIYAFVERSSDNAMFNFSIFSTSPGSANVWAAPGSLPVDLTALRGKMEAFKLGTLPLYYRREWTFPSNLEQEAVQIFNVLYWSPTLGYIASEEVVFHPATMSFNVYQAEPYRQGEVEVVES